MNTKTHTSSGFSLLELIVVITILSIIATVVTPSFIRISHEAKLTKVLSDINNLGSAVIQRYHEMSGQIGVSPNFANVGSPVAIQNNTLVFQATNLTDPVYFNDLISSRNVPVSPIDNQPYMLNIITNGSVAYSTLVGGATLTTNVDPEFQIYWISSDAAQPDTLSAYFKP